MTHPVRRTGREGATCPVLAVVVVLFLASMPAQAAGRTQPTTSPGLAIVEETETGLTLLLTVPEPSVRAVTRAGTACYQVEIPGLAPSAGTGLPAYGALLAVPGQEVEVEVSEGAGWRIDAHPLCPTERYACKKGSGALPCEAIVSAGPEGETMEETDRPLAQIEPGGSLRGVPAARLQVSPFRVEGSQIWFYPQLTVRLRWPTSVPVPATARVGGPFAAILRSVLLNPPAFPPQAPAPDAKTPAAAPATATGDPLKLMVDHDALFQVTYGDLVGAGWNPAELDPHTLRLTYLDVELPILVEGEADGAFDPGDLILFYGQGNTGPYSRSSVYRLSAGGAGGLRMESRDASPVNGYPVALTFAATLHAEQDIPEGYWQNPPGREAQDHWYWTGELSAPTSASLNFQMPFYSEEAASAMLRVRLAGKTDDTANPDHHTRLWLNGHQVSDVSWNGQVEFEQAAQISPTLLFSGNNTLAVESVGDTGALVDILYANWLEIDYQARYVAVDDHLTFGVPSAGDLQFRVSCFTAFGVEAYDITDPLAPVSLEGVETMPEEACYTAVFEDEATAGSRYLALAPARRQAPAAIVPDLPSDLHNPANGADEIILAYDGFYDDLQPLVTHRQSQGLRVQAIKITDVYDEFSAGHVTPQAIRDFLAYAYASWAAPAPTYVLLVGDAHLDWLDRFGTGKPIFLPSRIIDASDVGETADDTWYARVDGDDPLPDLLLGRFPARTVADVQAMVAKTIAYDTSPPAEPWAGRALFVADDDRPIFESASEAWIGRLQPAYEPQRIYASDYPPGNPTTDIVNAINAGAFLVAYAGHGNQDRWGTWSGGTLFTISNVAQLNNAGKLPFVATATCLNGFFVNPIVDYCLAEELARRADAGSAGVWSPTALGSPVEHELLFADLFDSLRGSESPTQGSVTTQAKLAAYAQGVSVELLYTFALFGDPALGLAVPDTMKLYLPLAVRGAGP